MKKMKGVCLWFFIYVFILKLMFRMKSKKQTTAKALFLGVAAMTLRHQRAATTGRWIFPATAHAVFYWQEMTQKSFDDMHRPTSS